MPLKFGTSGVRGLVTNMTDEECYLYSKAFIEYLKAKSPAKVISLSGDLRSSTPRIKKAVAFAIREEGLDLDNCGDIPTGALTFYGIQEGRASIMVTGSHIPDDRNGIKFNMPWGEILKEDEMEISRRYEELKIKNASKRRLTFDDTGFFAKGFSLSLGAVNKDAESAYIKRFMDFFPENCLEGLKVVLYEHSSVGRDILREIFERLGAELVLVGRSQHFIPVDTEAVNDEAQLAAWVKGNKADALISTDGDADRPLLIDETGRQVRGDIMGIIVSDFLKADAVATPVSCNTALEKSGKFRHISRTRIGSPYVIAAMNASLEAGYRRVTGYEANGGFLTGTDIISPFTGASLRALPTRDAAFPLIAILFHSLNKKCPLSDLLADLPPRFMASGVLKKFPINISNKIIEVFTSESGAAVKKYLADLFGEAENFDYTDGIRMTFRNDDIVHLRPSGNAPEFRCYTESSSESKAIENNRKVLHIVERVIRPEMEGR
ncbi:MAG: phosphomannomutase [bacterium]|nr:phosphomannomutase [bacterium]